MAYALPVAFCTVWIVLCHSFCFVDFAKNKCFFFFLAAISNADEQMQTLSASISVSRY